MKKALLLLFCLTLAGEIVSQINFTLATGTPFTGAEGSSVAFADVDGDNDQDVLVTGNDATYSPTANLYLNNGSGVFSLATGTPFTAVNNSSVAFADIDGDNDQDVLITGRNSSSQGSSKLYTNNGSGVFTLVSGTPFTGVFSSSIDFADVDGDNDQDVLITGLVGSGSYSTSELYTNNGSGVFTLVSGTPFVAVYQSSVAFADVDGDLDQDLLITGDDGTWGTAALYLNDGIGTFTVVSPNPFMGARKSSVAFADIDADNDLDVIIAGINAYSAITTLYKNNGSGVFSIVSGTPFDNVLYCSIAFADVDGDSDKDVLITGDNNIQYISKLYANNGSGVFSLVTGMPFDNVAASSVAFADVDGDSDKDLLITGHSSASNSPVSKLYLNTPATTSTQNITSCSNYTSPSGNYTWTTSGTYMDTIPNAGGGDSIMTINLTITNPFPSGTVLNSSVTALCDSGVPVISLNNSNASVYYFLKETTNNTVLDGPVAGTGSSLTFSVPSINTTTTYQVSAVNDHAIALPGNNDYAQYATPFYAYSDQITIEAWVNFSTGTHPWAGQGTLGTDNMSTNVWLWHSGTFYVNDAGNWRSLNFPSLPTGWTHVATVADPTGLYIYYDGNLVASNANGITAFVRNNPNSSVILGTDVRYPTDATRNSNNAFDNFRIWNTAKTASEIDNYSFQCDLSGETGLVLNTLFNEGSGTTATSATGSTAVVINPGSNWDFGSNTCIACSGTLPQTVSVTVNNTSTGADYAISCGPYTWPRNGLTYNSSTGSPTFTLTNAAGCDSVIYLYLTVFTPPDTTTTLSGITISSNNTGLASYQWIDCDNGNTIIPGATTSSYTPSSNGNFAVIIDNGNCIDTSACVSVLTLGLSGKDSGKKLSVFPNPSAGKFMITGLQAGTNIAVFNAIGEMILSERVVSTTHELNLSKFVNGIYFLKTSDSQYQRLMKQD